ncbi:hypothetical protein GQF61_07660 [Sphingobacterium sp. DK4209]|uniref:Signal transduction histidine kinase internal region domain-containing protein n=1 Tax=Sphingobacterium zhuxiongii TaxID=2662364 RepID=A0A5Q0QJG7_9SPHI|nr:MULTISPECIES: histidine kinase [unclassified Sphingobacterium]MVZ65731.1 hypothetical protein [Sphingobacterium sp. DK4209]QGA27930.1 hypothetical protein GFH32_17055 [Sphingobacterium sp. dk4302]
MKPRAHILFWIGYTIYFYLLNKLGNPKLSIMTVVLSIPLFMLIFYALSHILKRYFACKKYVLAFFLIVVVYGTTAGVLYAITCNWLGMSLLYGEYLMYRDDFDIRKFLQTYLVLIGHFSFLAILGYQYNRRLMAAKDTVGHLQALLKEQTLRKSLAYNNLSQQVPPHLLVNVFQSWSMQLRNRDLNLTQQIDEMYALIHFFMLSCSPGAPRTILLSKEVEMCKRYLRIQQDLHLHPFNLSWDLQGNLDAVLIPPTSLITLCMNIHKHGDLFDEHHAVQIQIHVHKGYYLIDIENPIPRLHLGYLGHGVGLKNLQERLAFVFGSDFSLEYGPSNKGYRVHLKVGID